MADTQYFVEHLSGFSDKKLMLIADNFTQMKFFEKLFGEIESEF